MEGEFLKKTHYLKGLPLLDKYFSNSIRFATKFINMTKILTFSFQLCISTKGQGNGCGQNKREIKHTGGCGQI
jgi:hypothetical protein